MQNGLWLHVISMALFLAGVAMYGIFFYCLTSYLEIRYPEIFLKIVGNDRKPVWWTPNKNWRLWSFCRKNNCFGDSKLAYYMKGYKTTNIICLLIWALSFAVLIYSSKHK